MASYSLAFKRSIAKDLQGTPSNDLRRLPACIEALVDNRRPHGCQKLSGQGRQVSLKPWRVIYQTSGRRVIIHLICDGRRDMQTVLARRLLG